MTNTKKKEKEKSMSQETYIISQGERKLLELVNVAKEIVFNEDKILFKELAKK
ncbi:MAG: hypothetical protein ACI83O_000540 [Patescibacteria group bacterium]|jgi:hypothetical protein